MGRSFVGLLAALSPAPVVRGVVQRAGGASASLLPALALGGALAAALTMPAPAEAIVITFPPLQIRPSAYWAWSCGSFPGVPFTSCWSRPSGRWGKKLHLVLDPPGDGLKDLFAEFSYDLSLLSFDASATSLLCELRSPNASTYCPVTPPGKGTMPIGTLDPFEVDQTGLTITEDFIADQAGGPGRGVVKLQYASPTPLSIPGERNFLALAFDALVPLGEDASVTYSPDVIADSTILMGELVCNQGDLLCGSSSPTASMRLNRGTVPGPAAVGGLPMVLLAARRLRRRIQLAER